MLYTKILERLQQKLEGLEPLSPIAGAAIEDIYQQLKALRYPHKKAVLPQGTARCRKCSFLLKFANNIHYKYKTSQASKAATLQSSKHADA